MCCVYGHNDTHRALVEAVKLQGEKSKRAKVAAAGGESEDPELLARLGQVKDGIYKRLKLLATWADLDDEQVCWWWRWWWRWR